MLSYEWSLCFGLGLSIIGWGLCYELSLILQKVRSASVYGELYQSRDNGELNSFAFIFSYREAIKFLGRLSYDFGQLVFAYNSKS